MDGTKLILTEPVLPPVPLGHLDESRLSDVSQQSKEQIAKDFESLLLDRLLDAMNNTIGNWGFDKDGASTQVQGIFWMYLARDIANNGGMGLWKEIHQSLARTEQTDAAGKSVDGQV